MTYRECVVRIGKLPAVLVMPEMLSGSSAWLMDKQLGWDDMLETEKKKRRF